MRQFLTELPRFQKRLIAISFDLLCVWFSIYAALFVRYGHFEWIDRSPNAWLFFGVLAPLTAIPFFIRMGLYRAVLRYINSVALVVILKAVFYASFTLLVVDALFLPNLVLPRSAPFIYFIILSVLMLGSRYVMQSWLLGVSFKHAVGQVFGNYKHDASKAGREALVVGQGKPLLELVEVLDKTREYNPLVLVDLSGATVGGEINGKPIIAITDVSSAIEQFSPEEILLALPEMKKSERKRLILELEKFPLPIRTMPSMDDLAAGRLKMADVQDVDIADVLGREEVQADQTLLSATVQQKVVLITGAGGSIGAELVRQVVNLEPQKIILLDHSEFSLYSIDKELKIAQEFLQVNIPVVTVLQSVTDMPAMVGLLKEHDVQTIYHAAAYKHVPLVESNIAQGLRNNLWGTLAVAQAAVKAGVEKFILISTDKAVRPTNIMGASKRLAELALQAMNDLKDVELFDESYQPVERVANNTCFTMVRFGNVLGSSGSVIPLFKEQIKTGGPVTITHPDIVRYFMSIPEATELVLQAGAMAKGGEVFVLDMGEPVNITDLAKRMISLSGLTVKDDEHSDGDIELIYTGLRPGEKLYEELLIGENPEPTQHKRIFKANEHKMPFEEYIVYLSEINRQLQSQNYESLQRALMTKEVGYHVEGSSQ